MGEPRPRRNNGGDLEVTADNAACGVVVDTTHCSARAFLTKGVTMPRSLTVSVSSNTISAAQKKNAPTKNDSSSLIWSGVVAIVNEKSEDRRSFTIDEVKRSPENFLKFLAMSLHYLRSIGKTPSLAMTRMKNAMRDTAFSDDDSDFNDAASNLAEAHRIHSETLRFLRVVCKSVDGFENKRLAGCDLARQYATARHLLVAFDLASNEGVGSARKKVAASVTRSAENDKRNANKR